MKRRASIFIMGAMGAMVIGASSVGSASKLIPNWKALQESDQYEEGVDYSITVSDVGSSVSVVAPHGGKIEFHSEELARELAGTSGYNLYVFSGHARGGGNMNLHITSTKFDEPRAVSLVKKSARCVSFHGCGDSLDTDPSSPSYFPPRAVCVGGSNKALRDAFIAQVGARPELDGYVAVDAVGDPTMGGTIADQCSGLSGEKATNIVNRCGEDDDGNGALGGLQLEMTGEMREALSSDAAARNALFAAVREALR